MFKIISHTIKDSIYSGRILFSFLVMVLTFLVSMGMMYQEYSDRIANYDDSLSIDSKELFWGKIYFWQGEDGNWQSNDTLTFPMGIVRKPSALLFIARGMDKQMRQSVELLTTFPIIDLTIKPDQEANLYKIAFEAPDYLFILKVLISLLAILFSYNLVCAEKEQGTLKLLIVSGASRTSIFAGKFFGSLISLIGSFSGAFLIYIFPFVFFSSMSFDGETGIRLLLVWFSSVVHIAVFFAAGAMISTFFRESAPSLIVSLFAWLVIVFVLPGLSALLAQQFVPVDSDEKVARIKLETAQQMERQYAESHPEDDFSSSSAGYGQRHDEIREEVNSEMKKIDDAHVLSKERQAELTTTLSRISPIGSLTYIMTSLANNGVEDMRLYRQDLVRMRDKVDNSVTALMQNPDIARLYIESGWDMPEEMKASFLNMAEIGLTQGFVTMNLSQSLRWAIIDYLFLLMFIVIPTTIGFFRFMSYDPR